jgi:hypothetical protein
MNDEFISKFTSSQIDQGVDIALKVIKLITLITSLGYDIVTIQNHPEWSYVVTDSVDKVLAGVRVDGSVFIGEL